MEGFRLGKRAFKTVSLFDVSNQRVKLAAEASLPESQSYGRLSKRHQARMDRGAKLLLLAADEAWQQAQWSAGRRLPLILGTTSGGMSVGETYYRRARG